MVRLLPVSIFALLAACGGQSQEQALEDAANQSDPAAAAVLNQAAEQGVNPQQALEAAGQAAAANQAGPAAGPPSGTVQARPNLPGSPNRKDGTQPPDKVATPTAGQSAAASSATNASTDAAANEHAGH